MKPKKTLLHRFDSYYELAESVLAFGKQRIGSFDYFPKDFLDAKVIAEEIKSIDQGVGTSIDELMDSEFGKGFILGILFTTYSHKNINEASSEDMFFEED